MILEQIKQYNDHFTTLRHHLHQYPEVSGHEKETAAFVVQELATMPQWHVTEGVGGGYGVLAELKGGKPGKTVALRADMDALQITEESEVEYSSKNPGVMHACGHDVHTAILLGVARILADCQSELTGSVRLIFQPSEELSPNGGSRSMIDAGVLNGVDSVFGLHIWPQLPHGTVACTPGPIMAASDHIIINIHGRSSHAAKPNEGIDAVVVGAQVVSTLQSIVSRATNPLHAAVLTIGRMEAGTRYNIVAESCMLEGTCRTLNEDTRTVVAEQVQDIVNGVCSAYGATGTVTYERGYMPVINEVAMTKLCADSATDLFGSEMVLTNEEATMCAEDFAFYLKECPGSFLWLGTGMENADYPLHNCHLQVDDDILWRGAALLTQIAKDALNR